MRRRFLPLTSAALAAPLLMAAPYAGAASNATTSGTSGVTFGVPRIVDPIHTYGEPDIAIGPTGDVVVSGPQGTGVQRSIWNVSRDNGNSWRYVMDLPQGTPAPVPPKSTAGPGGGDTELAIDHTGKIYYSDLYALQCFTAATSPDHGATVKSSPLGCSHPEADRQWYALYDPKPSDNSISPYYAAHRNAQGYLSKPLLYLSYNDLVFGAQLDKSTDGLMFTPAGKTQAPPGVYGDGTGGNNVADGNIVIDQHTGKMLALVNHSEAGKPNGLALAVGTPDVDGDMTFSYKTVAAGLALPPDLLFPVLAQDSNRTLYATWIADGNGDVTKPTAYHVFYSYATEASGWTKWSAPRQLDAPPSLTNVFPWVAAGGKGNIDVVWYGADRREDPSKTNATNQKKWNVFMAQVSAADTAAPAVIQTKVTPHPMHYNDICLLGSACVTNQGNRNLADFFQVKIDREGRARVVYDDTSNGLIQPGFEPTNGLFDHSGAAVVTVGTQSTGRNAWTGAALSPLRVRTPHPSIGDPTGDALVNKPIGGTNAPGADVTAVSVAPSGNNLVVKVTTAAGSLGSAALQAGTPFGQLVVRWQMGNTLYYAAVEQAATGGATTFYAGRSGSIDLCSVSACSPHFLTYYVPPAGGTGVSGSTGVSATGVPTYTVNVPLSLVGSPTSTSLLEEVTGYAFVSTHSAKVPITNAEADAEEGIPVEIEGTEAFNALG